jgi:hypothetical protein
MIEGALARAIGALERSGIPYMLTGSFAGAFHGVATAEDVVLSKLEWARLGGSERQIDDAAGILRARSDLDREYIGRWVERLGLTKEWEAAGRR